MWRRSRTKSRRAAALEEQIPTWLGEGGAVAASLTEYREVKEKLLATLDTQRKGEAQLGPLRLTSVLMLGSW